MTISDVISLVGIIASLLTSIIAIIISVKSLRQNSKMMENTFRPYIGIYMTDSYIATVNTYIVIKNFGQSSAYIQSFEYDCDIHKIAFEFANNNVPFENIEGSSLLPGQAYRCMINLGSALNSGIENINFKIIYTNNNKKYCEETTLKMSSNSENLTGHTLHENTDPFSIISETLQDMHLHSL